MSRLASSARDFAIACLARGDDGAAGDALLTIGDYAADAALRDHLPWRSAETGPDGKLVLVWRGDRRVRARVALYLRTLRRAEALERWVGGREAEMCCFDSVSWARYRWIDTGDRLVLYPWRNLYRHARPLWLDAPAFQAGVTPKDRRRATMSAPRDA